MDVNDRLVMDDGVSSSIDDKKEGTSDKPVGRVTAYVHERYQRAKDARRGDEVRWLQAYRNYRGVYSPDMQFTETERSRVFIKVTKTKVQAAYGQLCEVMFGSNRFPISINPTTLPEGVAETVYIDAGPSSARYGLSNKVAGMNLRLKSGCPSRECPLGQESTSPVSGSVAQKAVLGGAGSTNIFLTQAWPGPPGFVVAR